MHDIVHVKVIKQCALVVICCIAVAVTVRQRNRAVDRTFRYFNHNLRRRPPIATRRDCRLHGAALRRKFDCAGQTAKTRSTNGHVRTNCAAVRCNVDNFRQRGTHTVHTTPAGTVGVLRTAAPVTRATVVCTRTVAAAVNASFAKVGVQRFVKTPRRSRSDRNTVTARVSCNVRHGRTNTIPFTVFKIARVERGLDRHITQVVARCTHTVKRHVVEQKLCARNLTIVRCGDLHPLLGIRRHAVAALGVCHGDVRILGVDKTPRRKRRCTTVACAHKVRTGHTLDRLGHRNRERRVCIKTESIFVWRRTCRRWRKRNRVARNDYHAVDFRTGRCVRHHNVPVHRRVVKRFAERDTQHNVPNGHFSIRRIIRHRKRGRRASAKSG